MKLSKSQFCTAVRNYRSMLEEEHEILDVLGIGSDWIPSDWINTYYELLSEVCELEKNPLIGTDLDWFCFETSFGKYKDMCQVFDNNTGRTWTIETPEVLYDFITRNE
jgi:hypothetical protein